MGSRVYKVGNIVSRVNRLLQTGVLKKRPVWLDVVEAFPPDVFPKYNSTPEGGRAPEIVYPEDQLRKQFHEKYTIVHQPNEYLCLFEEKPDNQSVCSSMFREANNVLRFVSEQMRRISMGEDEMEAGRQALWLLRDEGIDIRVTQQTTDTSDTTSEAGDEEDVHSTLKTLKGILEQMHSKTNSRESQKH